MEYYASVKKTELMKFAHKWMELEYIITQTQKGKCVLLSATFVS